jgi:hypothetical protein
MEHSSTFLLKLTGSFETRGLYCRTFYTRNFCLIVISQSVCHLDPSRIFAGKAGLPEWSSLRDFTLMEGLRPRPQILGMGVSEGKQQTLVYYDTATITAVKCFIIKDPRLTVENLIANSSFFWGS